MQGHEFVARYWKFHCEHRRHFPSLAAAIEFLRRGHEKYELAVDCVTRADGTEIVSREDLHEMLPMSEEEFVERVRSFERKLAAAEPSR